MLWSIGFTEIPLGYGHKLAQRDFKQNFDMGSLKYLNLDIALYINISRFKNLSILEYII